MARYSRLSNQDDDNIDSFGTQKGSRRTKNRDEIDNDSVALILGQQPPRLSRFGRNEYVQLDDLDSNGAPLEPERGKTAHEKFVKSRERTRKLVLYIFLATFVIVSIAAMWTLWERRSQEIVDENDSLNQILSSPLDPKTQFNNGTHDFNRITLVVSLSGMHPHYLSEARTQNLHKLVKNGFATAYIRPSFPTETAPNHWTLITGNYPINHGIVGSTFYDPEIDLRFVEDDLANSTDKRFWGGEPIWVTAAQNNIKSAVHMWPGAAVEWGKFAPSENAPYDPNEPLDVKASKILSWLDKDDVPQLMLASVPNIALVTKKSGIDGTDLILECMLVDIFIGKLMDGIAARNLTDIVNLVVVSDHGMAPTGNDNLVFVDDIIPNIENATYVDGWPLVGIRFKTDEELEAALSSANEAQSKTGYTVYSSDKMPFKWKFSTKEISSQHGKGGVKGRFNQRLSSIYIVPDPTYSLLTHKQYDDMGQFYNPKGADGYDNNSPLMRGLFVAQGPAFPAGRYSPFDNIDVYSAICRSLGFSESSQSDGNFHAKKFVSGRTPENYPGTSSVNAYFRDSTFDDFYIHENK